MLFAQQTATKGTFLRPVPRNFEVKTTDLHFLTDEAPDAFYYFPNTSKDYQLLNSQTIEANRLQAYRDAAQQELSEWIRFSSKDAK